MDKRRRHEVMRRLGEAQLLRVARERLQLLDAQADSTEAEQAVERGLEERDQCQQRLDHLLAGQLFCPVRYRLSCESLLIAEDELDERNRTLEDARQAEDEQRVCWHQNRLQSEWIDHEAQMLGRKLARAKDDKATTAAISALSSNKRGAPWN